MKTDSNPALLNVYTCFHLYLKLIRIILVTVSISQFKFWKLECPFSFLFFFNDMLYIKYKYYSVIVHYKYNGSIHAWVFIMVCATICRSIWQPTLSLVLAVSFHDLHTWMTSSYMTYKTCFTLRLRHVPHPDTKGHGITGVHAHNTHKDRHTWSVIG